MEVFDEPLALTAGDVFLTASIGVALLGSRGPVRPHPT